ncbi:MAG: hypothetical protein P8Y42_03360 [Exilibacterium sp.]
MALWKVAMESGHEKWLEMMNVLKNLLIPLMKEPKPIKSKLTPAVPGPISSKESLCP